MADSNLTRFWVKFFNEAQISSTSAADYARSFIENRIEKEMLLHLNKEYLRDMGITIIGDIIRILQHARIVHDQVSRENVLLPNIGKNTPKQVTDNEEEDEEDISDAVQVRKSVSAASNILNRYIRNSSTTSVPKAPKVIKKKNNRLVSKNVSVMKTSITSSLKRKSETLMRQISESSDDQNQIEDEPDILQAAPVSILKKSIPVSTSELSPPLKKKARRVLPEYKGPFTIIMPKGNTARSREMLERYKDLKSKTMFDQLDGDSNVTSTTQTEEDVEFKVTMMNYPYQTLKTSLPEKNPVSVFDRLGNKTVERSIPKHPPSDSHVLQYNGILKKKSSVVRKPKLLSTMRADQSKVSVKLRAVPKTRIKESSVQIAKKIKNTINCDTEGILAKHHSNPVLKKTSIKKRLGYSSERAEKTPSPIINQNLVDVDEESDFITANERPAVPKKVRFSETEKSHPSRKSSLLPPNIGSIVQRTGIFRLKT